MADRASRIELVIQARPERGELVPLRTFARATESFTDLLGQVAADQAPPVSVEWFVSHLETGRTILEVEGWAANESRENPVPDIVRTTVDALEMLESGSDLGGTLSYRAVEQVRALASLVNDGAETIVVRGSGREVSVTETSASRTKELLARRLRSFGSIEGAIEAVSIHDLRPYFTVIHALDGHGIKCRCSDELLAQVKDALGSRIRVVGTIFRRFDGRAESVDVTELYVLRRRDQLSQVHEIRGIYADIDGERRDGERTSHG